MTEPCDLAAVEARRLIGARRLSPVELVESCLARIERVNGAVNAVVTLDRDMALGQARAAEAAVMAGAALGLLHGLPVAAKDLDETAGLRTTHGSLLYKDHVPVADDPMIASLRAAGGLVFMKTNTPEFGTGGNTTNRVFGATGNPFEPRLTAGGSSGGSAVALATGMAPLATGSDMGGSLRTPASFCGVVGFRPSAGLVPDATSTVALSPFAVLGPMARSVGDAHLLLRAQARLDRADPYASREALDIPAVLEPADLSRLLAAFSADLGVASVEGRVRRAFAARVAGLKHHFRDAIDAAPDFSGVDDIFETLRAIGFVAAFAEPLARQRHKLGPELIDNTERGLRYAMADVARAHSAQTALYRRFNEFFAAADVLIAPAAAVSPFPHVDRGVAAIDGAIMPTYMRWLALAYAPTMGLACVAAIPAGSDEAGMPFGLQVIGPRGSDARVLGIALALESILACRPDTARPTPDLTKLTAA